jgi:truncated hemoglobin YjbI
LNDSLPESAAPAWQAYNAMEATKQRHFAYLSALDARYSKYGAPDEAERAMLARLLKEHDAQVSAFKAAIGDLRVLDAAAHAELLDYIGQINAALAPLPRKL